MRDLAAIVEGVRKLKRCTQGSWAEGCGGQFREEGWPVDAWDRFLPKPCAYTFIGLSALLFLSLNCCVENNPKKDPS